MATVRFSGGDFKPFTLKLDRFQDHMDDAEPAFEAMAQFQVTVVNNRQFKEQGTPETGKWAPLSPPYAARKARLRPGRPILVFDGDLRESLTELGKVGIYEVWNKGFVVGTALSYARYHQDGTPTMPARKLIGSARRSDVRQFAKILQRWIVEGVPQA